MQLWAMLETLQSIPIWLFLCFALLLVALAWWQAPRIRPQLVGFGNTQPNKDHPQSNLKYWSTRLSYLFYAMVIALVIDSIIRQQSTLVNTVDAEGNNITQAISVSYGVKRRAWQRIRMGSRYLSRKL